MRTGMDYLVMENMLLDKSKQIASADDQNDWQQDFPPD